MSNFIKEPLKNSNWDPSKGDYYNKTLFAEDKEHEKGLFRKKVLVASLAFAHIVGFAFVLIYFS